MKAIANEKPQILYSSPRITLIRMIRLRDARCAVCVTSMGGVKNAYIVGGTVQGRDSFEDVSATERIMP
jgi:hypothetical protein